MKRGVLLLSGLLVILTGAALVHWAAGFPAILPWPILLVVLAIGGGGFVMTLLRDQADDKAEQSPTPATVGAPAKTPRITKKHRPRARAKKRIIRNVFKRRRTRKAGAIVFSHDQTAHPGDQQVGFFG